MSHVVPKMQQQVVKGRIVYNSSVDKRKCEGLLARGNQVKPPLVPMSGAVLTWVYKKSCAKSKGCHGQFGRCDILENTIADPVIVEHSIMYISDMQNRDKYGKTVNKRAALV